MSTEGLEALIRSNEWLMHVLKTVRATGVSDGVQRDAQLQESTLPGIDVGNAGGPGARSYGAGLSGRGVSEAWVGAGVVRDLVWGECFGSGFEPGGVRDVDVAFFDPIDLSRDNDRRVTAQLHGLDPSVPWEATNQAAVHTWYPGEFGGPEVAPLTSIAEAVGTWPETATAVAVRLAGERLEVCAPLGLEDLLNGVWRRNPTRVSPEQSAARLARHRPGHRWPKVTVIAPR